MAAIATSERARPLPVPRWLRDASYSVYLFQFVFIGVVWQGLLAAHLADRLPHAVLFLLLSGAALLGGVAVSRAVEQPLLQVVRDRTRRVVAMRPV